MLHDIDEQERPRYKSSFNQQTLPFNQCRVCLYDYIQWRKISVQHICIKASDSSWPPWYAPSVVIYPSIMYESRLRAGLDIPPSLWSTRILHNRHIMLRRCCLVILCITACAYTLPFGRPGIDRPIAHFGAGAPDDHGFRGLSSGDSFRHS
ncbi:hypothetical protein BC629DRAFT_983408 [Irpex lacteus]|nr:hypothetical protein BC629DRAFT_983408 [Irpex lacteus]